jgi:ribosomal protein S24E
MIHPEQGSISKEVIKAKLAKTLKVKEDCITIFGVKAVFGGGRSTGFALIYDSFDMKKKYDSKKQLKKVSRVLFSQINFYYKTGEDHRQAQERSQGQEGDQGPR